jgi:hypothetical protein
MPDTAHLTAFLAAAVVLAALGGRLRTALSPRWWRRRRVASGCTLIALGGFAAAGNRH